MSETNKIKRGFIQISLLTAGIGMCITGWVLGEPEQILQKAIRMCLECMGIG